MGIPIDWPNYTPGVECERCVDVIFGGVTPEKVIAVFEDIIECFQDPYVFGFAPNGTFELTQNAACNWRYFAPTGEVFNWQLAAGASSLSITATGFSWFASVVAVECVDAFTNQLDCLDPNVIGSGGQGNVFWGPGAPGL